MRRGTAADTTKVQPDVRYDMVRVLLLALDGKDPASRRHSERVARYSAPVAVRLGLGDDVDGLEGLIAAALLHDVGNIAVPDAILLKAGPLSELEIGTVRQHAVAGQSLVEAAGMPEVAAWIRHHHERFDGSGYPDGLVGEAIPIESRIIGAVEALEAMTTSTPYRTRVGGANALAELERGAGTQFDARVVSALADLIVRGGLQDELPPGQAASLIGERLSGANLVAERHGRQRETRHSLTS